MRAANVMHTSVSANASPVSIMIADEAMTALARRGCGPNTKSNTKAQRAMMNTAGTKKCVKMAMFCRIVLVVTLSLSVGAIRYSINFANNIKVMVNPTNSKCGSREPSGKVLPATHIARLYMYANAVPTQISEFRSGF